MHPHSELPAAFADLGIESPFLVALAKMGFKEPSEIQKAMIPHVLAGQDVLGQARTGTGKTAAFGLPLLQRIDPKGRLQAICLSPTRELAVQVVAEIRRLASATDLHIVPVYGGQKISRQVHLLGRKTQVVVGTPGRVLDMLGRGILQFDDIQIAVLDEVDRMLDIGFRDDIKRILGHIRRPHQTVFVSATIDDEINRLARRYMRDPVEINVSRDELTVAEVEQFYCSVERNDKYRLLRIVMAEEDPKLAIVFCNTKAAARKLAKKLHSDGIDAREIHGDLVQQKRERVMERFRRHQIKVLVATDLAARGLDVSAVSHIINYDIPEDPEVYVHRIGRTARMGARGRAIAFVTSDEGKQITQVEMLINKLIEERKYDGFTPSSSPGPATPVQAPPQESRYSMPASDRAREAAAETVAPPRTLGSKFRTRRGRRF